MLRTQDKRLFLGRTMAEVFSGAPNTGVDAYVGQVMASTPKAFWKLQEASGNPVDSSGNGLDLTSVTGTPEYQVAGPMPDTYSIRCAGGESLNRSSPVSTVQNNFTMEGLFYLEVAGANNAVILSNGTDSSSGWGIVIDENGTFQYLAGGIAWGLNSVGAITGAWHHVVVLRDAGTWKYYLDGVLNVANAGTTNPNAPSGTVKFNSNYVQMRYAYTAIYETVLSAETIAAHFAATGL